MTDSSHPDLHVLPHASPARRSSDLDCAAAQARFGDNIQMRIGPYILDVPLILAPMAGVTDRPFRQLCRHFGAALAVSEMTTSDAGLWHTEKSRLRMDHDGEIAPLSVQIAGYAPGQLEIGRGHV